MAPTTHSSLHLTRRRGAVSRPIALVIALLAFTLLGPATALAKGGGGGGGGGDTRPQVTVAGACGRGAAATLTLKARDGGIEAEFEVHGRSGGLWQVAFVQEGRIVWRGPARTISASRSFSIERRLADLSGADYVTARAVGPRGITCQANAMLPG